jgi:hypothetical protein
MVTNKMGTQIKERGSISTGTLRTEDLLFDFALALREFEDKWNSEHEALYDQAKQHMAQAPSESELNQTVSNLQDALQEYCPPFVYFGTLEGDGADFGFWADFDAVDESCARKHHRCTHNPDTGEIVLEDESVIVQVNDHGNVTVMDMERNVLWSVV